MGKYETDRKWSDITLPQIRNIVGPYLLQASSLEEDTQFATDLMILKARDMRIAARVRRPGYAEKYPYDITIRHSRESGVETEFSKIAKGYGDWFFYGHANECNNIDRWWLINLDVFRYGLIMSGRHRLRLQSKDNNDGTLFNSFDLRSFMEDPPILIAGSHSLETLPMEHDG